MRTVDDVIRLLPTHGMGPLSKPEYTGDSGKGVFLAVASMKDHMTDEGWQIAQATEANGYTLCGHQCTVNQTGVKQILRETNPGIVILQDKREWDVQRRDFRDKQASFKNVQHMKERSDLFKLTILKDSHQKPLYHRESADEIGCHAWIVYYHPRIVKHLAPYVREQHLIRTYHSIDSEIVPRFNKDRSGTLLSGAVSSVYPFRQMLVRHQAKLHNTKYLKHPGYHRNGSHTPAFLKTLNEFKTAICTSSHFGYALRKIIEATACGCRVLTDLPVDEVLPEIDVNLERISPHADLDQVNRKLREMEDTYDQSRQMILAEKAKLYYDYRRQGKLLVSKIEELRKNYQ